ncbi:outer membrane protein [Pseudogemmobacter sp. W21_MBD1_M6]|uniref:outer membrane protein n=1 Tax=Pseudogemmobacter sp. W21_MBD1_M6 TaxID=3240271 RepID=UPI003F9528A8
MKFYTLTAAAALMAAPAFAGNMTAPVIEQPVPVAAAPVTYGSDWTGGYIGAQLGYGDFSAGAASGDGVLGGLHAGYNYDFGTVVLGGEIDYDATDIDLGAGANVDSVARLKAKLGYDMGNTLIYATAGGARAETSLGTDNGYFGGVGLTYKMTDTISVGGEILGHKFDNFNSTGTDVDATTATVRVSYNF